MAPLALSAAGELRFPFLRETGDPFLEVLAGKAFQHFTVGDLERFVETAAERCPNLALHDARGSRRHGVGQHVGVTVNRRHEIVGLECGVDQSHARRLLPRYPSRREQNVLGFCDPDQAWQEPADPVFGHKATAAERTREHRFLCRKAQVTPKREHEPQAGHGTVDRRDDRLWDGRKPCVRTLKSFGGIRVEGLRFPTRTS